MSRHRRDSRLGKGKDTGPGISSIRSRFGGHSSGFIDTLWRKIILHSNVKRSALVEKVAFIDALLKIRRKEHLERSVQHLGRYSADGFGPKDTCLANV